MPRGHCFAMSSNLSRALGVSLWRVAVIPSSPPSEPDVPIGPDFPNEPDIPPENVRPKSCWNLIRNPQC